MLSDDAEIRRVPEVINPGRVIAWKSKNFARRLPKTLCVDLRTVSQRSIDVEHDQMHHRDPS
jgi:hypothetical protein